MPEDLWNKHKCRPGARTQRRVNNDYIFFGTEAIQKPVASPVAVGGHKQDPPSPWRNERVRAGENKLHDECIGVNIFDARAFEKSLCWCTKAARWVWWVQLYFKLGGFSSLWANTHMSSSFSVSVKAPCVLFDTDLSILLLFPSRFHFITEKYVFSLVYDVVGGCQPVKVMDGCTYSRRQLPKRFWMTLQCLIW